MAASEREERTPLAYRYVSMEKEMEPATGLEPVTSSLPTKCSTD